MTAVGDVFRLTAVGRYLSQQIVNVYHYRLTTLGTNPLQSMSLSDAFLIGVGGEISAATSQAMTWDELIVRNLNSLTDFWTEQDPSAMDGNVAGPGMPSFVTWNYYYPVPTKVIRGGRKSFAGVPEDFTIDNEPTAAAMPILSFLAAALDDNLTATDGAAFAPVVARRQLPEPATYIPVNFIPTTIVLKGIGTQNTRKRGRGA